MNEIKVGDYIRLKSDRVGLHIYQVDTLVDDDVCSIGVLFKHHITALLEKDRVEKITKETAFLLELKNLLLRFDAKIVPYSDKGCMIKLGADTYDFKGIIAPSNILDFDKE